MVSTLFPLQCVAVALLCLASIGVYKYKINSTFPGILFRWVMLMDLLYSIFYLVRWWPVSYTDSFVHDHCRVQVSFAAFFQLGSIYLNTAILGCLFKAMYGVTTVKREDYQLIMIGFVVFSLLAAANAGLGHISSNHGWCMIDNASLLLLISVYIIFLTIQGGLLLFILTQLKYAHSVGLMQRVRLVAILVSEMLMSLPLLYFEFNVLTGYGVSLNAVKAIAILFPLAHIIDACLMLSQVVYHACKKRAGKSKSGSKSKSTKSSKSATKVTVELSMSSGSIPNVDGVQLTTATASESTSTPGKGQTPTPVPENEQIQNLTPSEPRISWVNRVISRGKSLIASENNAPAEERTLRTFNPRMFLFLVVLILILPGPFFYFISNSAHEVLTNKFIHYTDVEVIIRFFESCCCV